MRHTRSTLESLWHSSTSSLTSKSAQSRPLSLIQCQNRDSDPLWSCLCPSWLSQPTRHIPNHGRRPSIARVNKVHQRSFSCSGKSQSFGLYYEKKSHRPFDHKVALEQQSTIELYSRLESWSRAGRVDECVKLVRTLVQERGEQANIAIYNALILSHTSYRYGSTWQVYTLLQEMEGEGIEPDLRTCEAILKVLAVHPDHLLRSDLLQFMKDKWLILDTESKYDIAIGQLREGCFEMALDTLDSIRSQGDLIEPWLLDMFAYMLGEAGELDIVNEIMRSRWEHGDTAISRTLWLWLLDRASSARHLNLTEFIWRAQVQPGYIQASSGICMSIMSTASRAGNPTLATEVFNYMVNRGDRTSSLHYQLLIDAYMALPEPDIQKALAVISVMSLEKLRPTIWQTRSLFVYLHQEPELVQHALEILRDLHNAGKTIPIQALNLIIECYVEQNNLNEAVKVYKELHIFARDNKNYADIETFNFILRACRTSTPPSVEQASFCVSELLSLQIQPTVLTYDRLILIFTMAAEQAAFQEIAGKYLDTAFQYFMEIETLGWRPRWNTIELLVTTLAKVRDVRCWDMLRLFEGDSSPSEGWHTRVSDLKTKVHEMVDLPC